jgi:6-methylsalicylate decarboxylase
MSHSRATDTSASRRVDLHAHHIPPVYRQALRAARLDRIGGIPVPDWSPEQALEFMDAHGIATQMLSVSDPGVSFVPVPQQADLAASINDFAADIVHAHADRFGAFAVLPLGDVAAARAEAARALDELGLDGVGVLSNTSGMYVGDSALEPLLADLDRRSAWVFLHPGTVGGSDKPSYPVPDFVAEYPFDTTRAVISLLVSGAFARYPRIRWHLAHGGGTLPMLRLRALAAHAKRFGAFLGLPEGSSVLTEASVDAALAACYYDTALIAEETALRAVADVAGSPHIVFGSDWPFAALMYAPSGDLQPPLRAVFPDHDRRAIEELNARREFERLNRMS